MSLLSAAALFTLATAQQQSQSVLQIPFYGYDTQSIDASIVGISNAATTLQLACPSGTDANDCGLFPSQMLTYGPSTYHMDLGVGMTEAFAGTQDCSRAGTTSAVCTESNTGSEANDPGMSTTSYEGSDIAVLPVTVTAGAEKLSAGAAAGGMGSASATATGTSSAGSAAATSSSMASSRSGSGSGSGMGTATQSASATGSSSAAVARVRVVGSGVVAGVVGVLGWMVL